MSDELHHPNHGFSCLGCNMARAWDEGFRAGSARRPVVEVTAENPYAISQERSST